MRLFGYEIRKARPKGLVGIEVATNGEAYFRAVAPTGNSFIQKFPWGTNAEAKRRAHNDLIEVDWTWVD